MSVLSEFKAFALKGNVVDLAVGVIVGAAFGKIVDAFVKNIIMPPIGWMIGGVNFNELAIKLPTMTAGKTVDIGYGAFIQTIIDFLIIAFVLFMVIKGMNMAKKHSEKSAPEVPAPAPAASELYLKDIRDALVKR